jgi:hypothetical protein
MPIGGLIPAPDTTYLLWCPEQSGWQTGEWWPVEGEEDWVSTAGGAGLIRLGAVVYLPAPPEPDDA